MRLPPSSSAIRRNAAIEALPGPAPTGWKTERAREVTKVLDTGPADRQAAEPLMDEIAALPRVPSAAQKQSSTASLSGLRTICTSAPGWSRNAKGDGRWRGTASNKATRVAR